eukprot:scaffold101519_cov60-Phaeocystis_antarctica.AAC.2
MACSRTGRKPTPRKGARTGAGRHAPPRTRRRFGAGGAPLPRPASPRECRAAEWRTLVRLRSESCDVEKKYRDVALRKRFGRNVPQADTRFPPDGAMRNPLPDKLVYLQATPRTTCQLANAHMKRPTARPEAAYSQEFDDKVKAKEFNLKAGIGKADMDNSRMPH